MESKSAGGGGRPARPAQARKGRPRDPGTGEPAAATPGGGECRSAPPADDHAELQRLLHELEVHQVELQVQNEELRTARLETEAALRRYAELFDFAPIGYVVVASDHLVREANLAAARLLGVDRARMQGRPLQHLLRQQHDACFLFLKRVLEREGDDRDSDEIEVAIDTAGGRRVHLRLTAVPYPGPERAALVAIHDVTRLREAENLLRAEARQKDEFLAMLSHELRNPLAPIRNSLFVMKRVPPGSEPALTAQSVIDRQVDHLTRIVDDLLDLTRVARGKVLLKRERVELGGLVRRAADDHRPMFQEGGIELGVRVASELMWAEADPTRLSQVLGNLLGNAAKFTARGGRVDVALRRSGERAAISVRDTGIGIAPEVRERLFEPFVQGPQDSARRGGGLGLGLAMVRGLVELHGGAVEVLSAGVGRGSEFVVTLPLASPPVAAEAPAHGTPAGRLRVLVIEDNVDAADSLRAVLQIGGHVVRTAYDGPSGLALARTFLPQVVICDIGLPGMDGYEVAAALRAQPLEDALRPRLVALSGYAAPEDRQRATAAGFDLHVSKPASLEDLELALAELAARPPR